MQGRPEASIFRHCADNGPGRESARLTRPKRGGRILITHKPRLVGAQPSDVENENEVIDLRDVSWVDRRPGRLAGG